MSKNRPDKSFQNVYAIIFLTLVGWISFAYFTMHQQIQEQHIYAELINITGKQRMLSQKTALFTARVYHNNETNLIEKRNQLIKEMRTNHEFIISHLTSDEIQKLYFAKPYEIDKNVKSYLHKLEQTPTHHLQNYVQNIFEASSNLLPKLHSAVNAFQKESEKLNETLQNRELFILIGSLSTLLVEYFLVFLPVLRRNRVNNQRLQETNQRLGNIMEQSPDGIFIIETNGQLNSCSQRAAAMLGYTIEEMYKLKILDWDSHLTPEQLKTIVSNLSTDSVSQFETVHKRKDGTTYDALIDARLIKLGEETLIYASVKDITALNELKRRLEIDTLKLKIAAQSANMGIWQFNPTTGELTWDSQMYKTYGLDPNTTVASYDHWKNALSDKDQDRAETELREAIKNKAPFNSIFTINISDGSQRIIQASAKYLFDKNGDIEWMVGTNRDITGEQEYFTQLNNLNLQLTQAQELVKLGHWELNHKTQKLFWSDEIYAIFELNESQFKPSYENFLAAIHPDDREKVNHAFSTALENKQPYNITHRLKMTDGRIKYVIEIGQTVYDHKGQPITTIGTIQDITERRLIEIKQEQYVELIDKNIITSETDMNGVIINVSEAFCQLSGYSKEELIGKNHNMVRHPDTPASLYKSLWATLKAGKVWQSEIKNRRKDGSDYWIKTTFSPVFNDLKQQIGFSAISHEITDKKRAEELSIHDQLTGLYNRLHLDTVSNNEIQRAKRYETKLSLILMDLDYFKNVNDTYGHLVGDEVLKQLAKILSDNTRASDFVGRWGGEEFLVMCPHTDLDSAVILAEKLRATISKHEFPQVGHLTSSFGVTELLESDHSEEEILSRADISLYKAKRSGRNRVITG